MEKKVKPNKCRVKSRNMRGQLHIVKAGGSLTDKSDLIKRLSKMLV